MKKIFMLCLAMMLLIVSGCGEDTEKKSVSTGKSVGVSMPTQMAQSWIQDGDYMKQELESKGYSVNLKYAEDDIQKQISQIQEMIDSDVNCLVVASIDSTKLVDVLSKAKEKNIPVIAYDRLLMDTDSVSYYASFDNKGVGIAIGRYVEEKLNLKNGSNDSYNAEFFAGSPDDNNAHFLNEGVFDVLQPYIDSGKLKVLSGETDFSSICILRWSTEGAKKRMADILNEYYSSGQKIDVIVSPYDGFDYGIIDALEDKGYKVGEDFPIITGQDADLQAIKNIISDKQSMTIFKDTRILAKKCAQMVEAVLENKIPEINDTISYDNHKMIVPSFLCEPVVIDKNNIDKALIESGYYTKEEIDS